MTSQRKSRPLAWVAAGLLGTGLGASLFSWLELAAHSDALGALLGVVAGGAFAGLVVGGAAAPRVRVPGAAAGVLAMLAGDAGLLALTLSAPALPAAGAMVSLGVASATWLAEDGRRPRSKPPERGTWPALVATPMAAAVGAGLGSLALVQLGPGESMALCTLPLVLAGLAASALSFSGGPGRPTARPTHAALVLLAAALGALVLLSTR